MQESKENSPNRDGLPWAFVLDPATNARALNDIQRRGFEAARQLIDRMLAVVDQPREARSERAEPAPPRVPATGDVLQELFGSWADVTVRVLRTLADDQAWAGRGPVGSAESHVVSVDLCDDRGGNQAPLRMDAQPTGELEVTVELWLHNPSSRGLGPIRIAVDDLFTPAGATLAGDRIRFEPAEIGEIPARSARGLVVTITGKEVLVAGSYSGTVRVEGVPGLVVPLRIDVQDAAP